VRRSIVTQQNGKIADMAAVSVGDQAPAFSRPNQDGTTVSLADFAGKYVLLWWYPKADTPG
jgi:thioredoxin-dependent peroxiredoxin